MIYFIKAGKHIKVGYTKDVNTFKVRLSTYNTSNPFEMEIINLIDGDTKLESDILNHFIKYHCKGEWFYYNEEIINFAKNPYEIPKSKFKKPLKDYHKIIENNIKEILELYSLGISLRELSKKFKVSRSRLVKYIPEDLRREKNEWFKLKRRLISPNSKEIICIETKEIFISLSDASRKMNLNLGKISEVCKGTRNHTGGYTFKYLEND
jgi:hypothetical protein